MKAKKSTTKRSLFGDFGEIYTQFRHKPKEAIKFLCKKKSGECLKALHRSDIGDIDIVWGEVTDPVKHKGFGLAHIIDKHGKDIKALGFEVEDFIPIIVQFGTFNLKKSAPNRKVYEGRGFRFVIATKDEKRKNKQWLLTAFNIIKKPLIKSGQKCCNNSK